MTERLPFTTLSGRVVQLITADDLVREHPASDVAMFVPHLLGPEPTDLRDIPARAVDRLAESLPPAVQLQRVFPVRSQEARGSCVGHAVAAMLEYLTYRQFGEGVQLSALMSYYLGRLVDGSVPVDVGTFVRSALKGARRYGIAPEPLWTYDGYGQKFAIEPDKGARMQAAFNAHGFTYVKLDTIEEMRASIAAGYGFCGIWTLFENVYQHAFLGDIQMPAPFEGARGAHSTFFTGYDDSTRRFTLKNSWGRSMGDGGYFTMPYDFVTIGELTDCWSVRPLV